MQETQARTLRAIKIDVIKQQVYEVELMESILAPGEFHSSTQELLSCEQYYTLCHASDIVNGMKLDTDTLVVDSYAEEKLPIIGGFTFDDYPLSEVLGHGLIIGQYYSDGGEEYGYSFHKDAVSTIEQILGKVNFIKAGDYLDGRAKEILKGSNVCTDDIPF